MASDDDLMLRNTSDAVSLIMGSIAPYADGRTHGLPSSLAAAHSGHSELEKHHSLMPAIFGQPANLYIKTPYYYANQSNSPSTIAFCHFGGSPTKMKGTWTPLLGR